MIKKKGVNPVLYAGMNRNKLKEWARFGQRFRRRRGEEGRLNNGRILCSVFI